MNITAQMDKMGRINKTANITIPSSVTDDVKGIKVPEGTVLEYKVAWSDWADYITDGSLASGEGWTLDSNGKLTSMFRGTCFFPDLSISLVVCGDSIITIYESLCCKYDCVMLKTVRRLQRSTGECIRKMI